MFDFIRRFTRRLMLWFRAEQGSPAPAPKLQPQPQAPPPPRSVADVYAAGLVPPPEVPPPQPVLPNRAARRAMSHQRRHYERERRKFDKFVTPEGEPAPYEPRGPREKREDSIVVDNGNDLMIVDKPDPTRAFIDIHHSDRKTDVLYETDELFGEFNFRDTILEQLERYFVYLERMKKRDPCAYGFYREVGATLLPYIAIPDIWRWHTKKEESRLYAATPRLSDWFRENRPGFGCIAYGTAPEVERLERERPPIKKGCEAWIPRFLYFTKYEDPPYEYQPIRGDGDVYSMTIWWDKTDPQYQKRLKGGGAPEDYGICVNRDGRIRVLKMLDTKIVQIPKKKNGLDLTNIPSRAWRIPHDFTEWARQHGTDVQHYLGHLFCDCAHSVERAAWSMVRVSVEKDGRHAMFGVDAKRLGYFFQDRDYEPGGGRKRIFHMVRPQSGQTRRDGVNIRMHFRGQREFTWAGYNVKLLVPGRDCSMLEECGIGAIAPLKGKPGVKYLKGQEFGKRLRQMIEYQSMQK